MAAPDLPLLTFADAAAFEAWLGTQPADAPGAWLRFAKDGAPEPTLSKSDAIDSALAHGWIDGQANTVDAAYFRTRFTPRRRRSRWSQVNRERVERLVAAGRMTPSGLRELDAANRYAVLHRVHAASAKRRAGIIARLADRLAQGETIHPRRAKR